MGITYMGLLSRSSSNIGIFLNSVSNIESDSTHVKDKDSSIEGQTGSYCFSSMAIMIDWLKQLLVQLVWVIVLCCYVAVWKLLSNPGEKRLVISFGNNIVGMKDGWYLLKYMSSFLYFALVGQLKRSFQETSKSKSGYTTLSIPLCSLIPAIDTYNWSSLYSHICLCVGWSPYWFASHLFECNTISRWLGVILFRLQLKLRDISLHLISLQISGKDTIRTVSTIQVSFSLSAVYSEPTFLHAAEYKFDVKTVRCTFLLCL